MSEIKCVIFDLDGVIVSTDEYHFRAWSALAQAEGVPFNWEDNERLRGVSRMESLEIILEKASRSYDEDEKRVLASRKNDIYRASLADLTPADILPGVLPALEGLRERGVRLAIGSSSANARPILEAIGLSESFDVIVDGTCITRSKPDPEVFVKAGERCGVPAENCLVVEDAEAGVEAGAAAGMPVLAVGAAMRHPKAARGVEDLAAIALDELLEVAS